MPALVPVESSCVAAVGYDASRRRLLIMFHGGRTYAYLDVPPEEHAALLGAASIGTYVNKVIKTKYAVEPL